MSNQMPPIGPTPQQVEDLSVAEDESSSSGGGGSSQVVSAILSRFSTMASSFRSQASSASSGLTSCRICRDNSPSKKPPMTGACKCAGSCGAVHKECLEKWLSASNHTSCEVCGFQFQVVKKSKPYSQWFWQGPFKREQRSLTGDLACFLVLTPLAVFSVYMCTSAATMYLNLSTQVDGKSAGGGPVEMGAGKWEAVSLIFLSSFLVLVYGLWFGLTLAFQCNAYKEWKKNNQEIRLANLQQSQQLRQDNP